MDKYKNKDYGLDSKFRVKPFLELSDKTCKIRRNLNITALIALSLTILDIQVHSINLSGVRVDGLTDAKLFLVLLCVSIYHAIYFIWCSYDEYWKWRLKLVTEDTNDYTTRQTGESSLSPCQVAVDSNLYIDENALQSAYSQLKTAIRYAINENKLTSESAELMKERFESVWCGSMQPTIEKDLARLKVYGKSFINYHLQEVIRFLLLEFGLPVLLSLYGCYELIIQLMT